MGVSILIGDCRDLLRTLPDDSVDCVVTSPPYWGLRSYGDIGGMIGLEPSLAEHLSALVTVFREVRRVLKPAGTCWINYGDAYACAPNGRSAADTKALGNDDRTFRDKPISTVGPILKHWEKTPRDDADNFGALAAQHGMRASAGGYMKPKDRMMLPARLAIALQEDGWWLRDEIVWHKPNPMPSSVKDRTTPAHEMIYLFTKCPRYFFDQTAWAEPAGLPKPGGPRSGFNVDHVPRTRKKIKVPGGWDKGEGAHGTIHRSGRTEAQYVDAEIAPTRNKRSVWQVDENELEQFLTWKAAQEAGAHSVWKIPPKPFREAHFATFPPALIEPCILAGCPKGGLVLDPFGGSGTTGLVADRHGRDAILIELNPEYAAMADRAIRTDAPLLAASAAA